MLAVLCAQPRVVEEHLGHHREARERRERERDGEAERPRTRPAAALVIRGKLRRVGEHGLRLVVHAARRLLRNDEIGHVAEDGGDADLIRAEALGELGERRARVVGAHRREPQRFAAFREAVRHVAERRLVLAEQERDLGIDLVGRGKRVRIFRDPLRQHRELVRIFDFAERPAALADLARRLLRELEQAAVALVDRLQAASERREALFVVDEARGRGVDALPAALDRAERFERDGILRGVERRPLEEPAVHERVEIRAKAFAAVGKRGKRGGLPLRRQRRAACEPLRQHLHLGGDRPLHRLLVRGAVVEVHHERGERHESDRQHAEDLELLDDRQVADHRELRRRRRGVACRAQLLHHRHRRQRVVTLRRADAHSHLRRRRLEVAVLRRHARLAAEQPSHFQCHGASEYILFAGACGARVMRVMRRPAGTQGRARACRDRFPATSSRRLPPSAGRATRVARCRPRPPSIARDCASRARAGRRRRHAARRCARRAAEGARDCRERRAGSPGIAGSR